MLVLERRVGEELTIGNSIRVVVLSVSGKQVHLGIKAPASLAIVRQELLVKESSDCSPASSYRSP